MSRGVFKLIGAVVGLIFKISLFVLEVAVLILLGYWVVSNL